MMRPHSHGSGARPSDIVSISASGLHDTRRSSARSLVVDKESLFALFGYHGMILRRYSSFAGSAWLQLRVCAGMCGEIFWTWEYNEGYSYQNFELDTVNSVLVLLRLRPATMRHSSVLVFPGTLMFCLLVIESLCARNL